MPVGDSVRPPCCESPGEVERVEQRDPPPRPEGTDADDVGDCDLDRLRLLLLGGVRESADPDLDRLGDRL